LASISEEAAFRNVWKILNVELMSRSVSMTNGLGRQKLK